MSVQTLDGADQALLDAARALVPRVRACADEIERERQLPQSLADALAAAGLFKLTVPRALGGAEAHPETVVRVIETLAAADGSAGWSAGIAAQCGIASGFFGAEAARAVYGDPPAFVALVTFRAGRAQAVDGGYRVTGRWSFASGCRHATWLGGGAIIYDWEQPRLGADGQPESRFFFFTAVACEIFDTWHVTGLRGTGSHEFAVADDFARLAILPSGTDHDNVDRGVVEALRAAFGDLVSEPVPHSVTMKRSMNSRLPIFRLTTARDLQRLPDDEIERFRGRLARGEHIPHTDVEVHRQRLRAARIASRSVRSARTISSPSRAGPIARPPGRSWSRSA